MPRSTGRRAGVATQPGDARSTARRLGMVTRHAVAAPPAELEVVPDLAQQLAPRELGHDDPPQRPERRFAVHLPGELEGGDVARGVEVRERLAAPEPVRI